MSWSAPMGEVLAQQNKVHLTAMAWIFFQHYGDVRMGAIASQITSLTIVYSIVYSDADQRKHQSSASLAFVRGIHRGPVNSPHKWPVTRKMFPFDDVIMNTDPLMWSFGFDGLKKLLRQQLGSRGSRNHDANMTSPSHLNMGAWFLIFHFSSTLCNFAVYMFIEGIYKVIS